MLNSLSNGFGQCTNTHKNLDKKLVNTYQQRGDFHVAKYAPAQAGPNCGSGSMSARKNQSSGLRSMADYA